MTATKKTAAKKPAAKKAATKPAAKKASPAKKTAASKPETKKAAEPEPEVGVQEVPLEEQVTTKPEDQMGTALHSTTSASLNPLFG